MQLHPAQQTIAKDTHRFRVLNCGRRFGKTTLAVWEMIGKAVAKNERRIAYIAPTYQQARDIAWEELKRSAQGIIINANESRLELSLKTQENGSSTIYLRGWESVYTLRGQRFDFVVSDEISSLRNWWVNWNEVLRPTLTDTKGDALFISTPNGFNHFYDLFNKDREDKDFKSFHFTSYDNPFIDTEEINKAKQELTEDQFAQEYLADFRKQQGLVYKEFSRDFHLFSDLTEIKPKTVLGGIDFGFRNPAAVLRVVVDADNTYWVTDEWYKVGRTEEEIAEYVRASDYRQVYPDPENASAIEVLRRKGVNVRDVSKENGSLVTGINKVRELFKQHRLRIHTSCVNLISELETYQYDQDKKDKEKPIKENDHALDALRYVLMMYEPTQPIITFLKPSREPVSYE